MCRIEHARVDDGAGEQCRFSRTEGGRAGVKISARGSFRAVHAVAPLDHVQVQLEYARLRQLGLETPRDEELAQLAHRILRRREVQILCELLSDRAAAPQQAAVRPVDLERLLQLLE